MEKKKNKHNNNKYFEKNILHLKQLNDKTKMSYGKHLNML